MNLSDPAENTHLSGNPSQPQTPPIAFWRLFRYSTSYDYFLMFIGTLAALAYGFPLPGYCLILGNMISSFGPGHTADQIIDTAKGYSLDFLYAGIGFWIASYISFASWMLSGERQSIEFRKQYFKALLQQEIEWYDKVDPNALTTRVSFQRQDIQGAIGEKCASFAYTVSMILGGFGMGFSKSWNCH